MTILELWIIIIKKNVFHKFKKTHFHKKMKHVAEYFSLNISQYLEKGLTFPISNEKWHYTIWWEFQHFRDFQILSNLGCSKSILGSYFAFLMRNWPENFYHITQTQNSKTGLFDLVTLDDLDLTRGHQRLTVLSRIPDTIFVVSSAPFPSDTSALPGEPSNDTSPKSTRPVTSSVILN